MERLDGVRPVSIPPIPARRGHRGPDDADDTPETWNAGLSGLLVEWDDGTGGGDIDLEHFLAAAGLALAPDAVVD
ncbi:hypothetical protein ACWGR4_33060 [Embleya sp. NPDC055664]